MNTRRTLLKSLVVAGLAPQLIRNALANGQNPVQAGLRKLSGPVFVNNAPAKEGMIINPGDLVVTGAKGEAVYVIGQDAFLQRADTQVRFPMDGAAFFRIVTGKLLSVFGKGEKKLFATTATIGIRGTGCYMECTEKQTYFCLCYGEAEVIPSAAPQAKEVIRTTHHDHPIAIHADASMPTAMVPATVINHTDAELILLESLVGRVPPFSGSGYKASY